MKKIIRIFFVILFAISFVLLSESAYRGIKLRKKSRNKRRVNPFIKVQVLNGTGRADLARRLTYVFRADSFDVVLYGNAPSILSKTVVVEMKDSSMRCSNYIADWYGIKRKTIEIDPDHIVDVAVVIGGDYKKIFPYLDTLKAIY